MVLMFSSGRTLMVNWCIITWLFCVTAQSPPCSWALGGQRPGPLRVHSCAGEASLGMLLLERREKNNSRIGPGKTHTDLIVLTLGLNELTLIKRRRSMGFTSPGLISPSPPPYLSLFEYYKITHRMLRKLRALFKKVKNLSYWLSIREKNLKKNGYRYMYN